MAEQKKGEALQSFQIGNLGGGGPRVPASSAALAKAQSEQGPSGIYPHLEALVERSDQELREFGEAMGVVCQQLDELINKRSGRVKEEAQRARQAYERTFNMINYLIEVKAKLIADTQPK